MLEGQGHYSHTYVVWFAILPFETSYFDTDPNKGRVSGSHLAVQSVVVDQKVRAIIHRFRNNGLLYSPLRPHTLNVFTDPNKGCVRQTNQGFI